MDGRLATPPNAVATRASAGDQIVELPRGASFRQLVELRVQESLRLGPASKVQQKSLKSHIAWLDKRIAEIDTDLRQRLRASPAWRTKDDLLRSILGVGATTSATLLAKLPELGTSTAKGSTHLRVSPPGQ